TRATGRLLASDIEDPAGQRAFRVQREDPRPAALPCRLRILREPGSSAGRHKRIAPADFRVPSVLSERGEDAQPESTITIAAGLGSRGSPEECDVRVLLIC